MRKKNLFKKTLNFSLIILITLLVSNIIIFTAKSQEKQLHILITDENNKAINKIEEGTNFKISVYIENISNNIEFLTDVNIDFNNKTYHITPEDDNNEKIIKAPEVNKDTVFTISASKNNYTTNISNITVINKPKLVIIPQEYVINAGTKFSVEVKNADTEKKIEGATVYIQNQIEAVTTTNSNGIAFLKAPEKKEKITVIATKSGYETDQQEIEINLNPSVFEKLINNEYFLIFLSIIFLVFSIVYVNYRQKKPFYDDTLKDLKEDKKNPNNTTSKSSPNSDKKKYDYYGSSDEPVKIKKDKDSKVEEIRIIQSKKDKDIVKKKNSKQETTFVGKNKKSENEWFKGKRDVRYEIDKLTGEIDENGKDKWFEGIEDLREKIDKKMKNKDKKEEEED